MLNPDIEDDSVVFARWTDPVADEFGDYETHIQIRQRGANLNIDFTDAESALFFFRNFYQLLSHMADEGIINKFAEHLDEELETILTEGLTDPEE